MANEFEYDDYQHDFMGKVGNIQDFSRDFLLQLANVFEDTIHYLNYAQTAVFGPLVGVAAAWDLASRMARGNMRPAMPMGRFIAPPDWDWKNAQYQARPFDVQTSDLTKPALMRLIQTYWDQYLKAQNLWLDQWVKLIGEEQTWNLQPEVYKLIIAYEYPKLARVLKIEPDTVTDYLKLACLSIDGTMGYGGEYVVINPNYVILNLRRCEVMQKYMDEGLYPPARAWRNCTFEQRISEPFFPGCKLEIKLPPPDLKIPAGEPFCVWTYTKGDQTAAGYEPGCGDTPCQRCGT